jgi:hypothetical protein
MHIPKDMQTLLEIFFSVFALIGTYIQYRYHTQKAKSLGVSLKKYYQSQDIFKKQALWMLPFIPLGIIYLLIEGLPLAWIIGSTVVIVGFYSLLYYAQMREFKKRRK